MSSSSTIKKLPLSKLARILIDLRTGLGAAKLSPKVEKVSLTFSRRQDNAGARYFLRENLPRIAYNNPDLPIEVNISKEYGVKPLLKVKFKDSEDYVELPLSQRNSSDICQEFLEITEATPTLLTRPSKLQELPSGDDSHETHLLPG
ncbi:2879_t:CDS:2 [Acaulospora morrowiae]|uniref:2879_t:CDS:1 n=1 Tax=Acaulospora morrowiae TaxID=94023 RepID=A0A9N9FKZ2_9GLOM|nr:2879_t:CDS:2 [Acaulospora morrowiae]